jgi:putative phage-type endonuclease
MKIITAEQRSPEWYASRCGVPSASQFDRIVEITGKVSKQRTKYLYTLAGEIITGIPEVAYQNGAMLRGIELEEEARVMYELVKGVEVQKVGFCMNESPVYGASPDGFIGEEGVLEIKSPLMSTHVGYLVDGCMPSDYIQQVQGQLLVTEREWCDFVSYYPGMKPLIVRVERDEAFIDVLQTELENFCFELSSVVSKIA